jgi:hypothetical protein
MMPNSLVTAGEWEFASPPRNPEQKPMEEAKDTRVFMYKLAADGETVESYMFASADDVPKGQGWVDTPAKVKKGKPLIDRKKAVDAESDD